MRCTCTNGFTFKEDKPKRCFKCNPPVFQFGILMEPVDPEIEKDLPYDEIKAVTAEALANYFVSAREYHDTQELARYF